MGTLQSRKAIQTLVFFPPHLLRVASHYLIMMLIFALSLFAFPQVLLAGHAYLTKPYSQLYPYQAMMAGHPYYLPYQHSAYQFVAQPAMYSVGQPLAAVAAAPEEENLCT